MHLSMGPSNEQGNLREHDGPERPAVGQRVRLCEAAHSNTAAQYRLENKSRNRLASSLSVAKRERVEKDVLADPLALRDSEEL